ncbi:putative cobaltochelatase [Microbispora bryophytorum subsp. camponoti]
MNPAYPFSAVVGLADLKLALVLNAVSSRVGGVLVRGEKGTAKSTIVRALAAQLPRVAVVAGCRFHCDPVAPDPGCPDGPHESAADPADAAGALRAASLVELPVGASEDRLVGSLDLERALTEGVKAFEPGLLAAAHRGVLYVDEVNLLHDHLVDLLLDAAALGVCYVERETVSVRHAARFLLVGTMNPEEGELRPQLLDRFGLTVEVRATREPDERAEVVRRRFAFDADPEGFAARWAAEEAALAARIARARAALGSVRLPDSRLRQITAVCAGFEVDGLRADLVTAHAAVAHAAWQGRDVVTREDVRVAARLALPHRRRRDPFDAPGLDERLLDELLDQTEPTAPGDPENPDDPESPEDPDDSGGPGSGGSDGSGAGDGPPADHEGAPAAPESAPEGAPDGAPDGAAGPSEESGSATGSGDRPQDVAAAGVPFRVPVLKVAGVGAGVAGRRSSGRGRHGRTIGARVPTGAGPAGIDLPATLLAAAPHQLRRGRRGPGLVLRRDDLREPVREGREGNLVLFVVDASGSMGARRRMTAVKTAVLSLLLDAYQRRDKIGLVVFRGAGATVALPDLVGRSRRGPPPRAPDRWPHPARRRSGHRRRGAPRGTAPRPRPPSPAGRRDRRPRDLRRRRDPRGRRARRCDLGGRGLRERPGPPGHGAGARPATGRARASAGVAR